ncbi:g7849 [Coccomyxa elongata]
MTCRLGERITHYASLITAEKPLEAHRAYMAHRRSSMVSAGQMLPADVEVGGGAYEVQADAGISGLEQAYDDGGEYDYRAEDDAYWEEYRSTIVQRWQGAAGTLISSAAMVRDLGTISDRSAPPADRFAATAGLAMRLEGHPNKAAILEALEHRRPGRLDSLVDNFMNELFITGERVFEMFTPARLGKHRLFFTSAWTFIVFAVFFYMIGEFPYYEAVQFPSTTRDACLRAITKTPMGYGSSQMLHWFNQAVPWCYDGEPWLLGGDYLIVWGARWGPLMRAQPYRWFTSWFLHQSFTHVLSNMLLFLVIACQMEEKYGCWRMLLLWLFSALGGNFFSAAFEDTCLALVGASGGVFGMVGLFIADMIVNFSTIKRPIIRSVMMFAFLIYFIVTVVTSPVGTSHLSHVGGFLSGLFPALLFLPHLKSERWEAWTPIVGAVVTVLIFVALPTYFYQKMFKAIGNCGTDITRYM